MKQKLHVSGRTTDIMHHDRNERGGVEKFLPEYFSRKEEKELVFGTRRRTSSQIR